MSRETQQPKEIDKTLTILLVEDSESDIKITTRAFEEAKLKNSFRVVRNGEEAIEYLEQRGKFANESQFPKPDLILLDINMPKMNGFQVLEFIKSHLVLSVIPVIMFTSSQNEQDILQSYKAGAASYIQKPVEYADFLSLINRFIFYWQSVRLPKW